MTIRHKTGAILTLALSLAAPAGAFEMPSAARFQQVLARQIDQEVDDRFAMIALYPDEAGRVLGQALLAQLGRQPSYLADLQRWLESNPARSEEELVQRWFRHYHTVFGGAVAFLEDGQVTLLWQLQGENAIAALDRSVCRSLSAAERTAAVARERADLVGRYKDSRAAALATAYARELARPPSPTDAARAEEKLRAARVMWEFQELKKGLAPDAQLALYEAFSFQPPERGPQALCERQWLASRAIIDAATGKARLLRTSVTRSGYSAAFRMGDRQDTVNRPTNGGFKPGAAQLAMPVLLARREMQGSTTLAIDVDAQGKVLALRVTAHALSPVSVTSADGSVFTSLALLVPELEQYYRAGTFAPKLVDGVAQPSTVSIGLNWH